MKFRLLTLFSIIVVLGVKTYTMNARDGKIDDADVELLTNWELKNKTDSIYHQKHVVRIVEELAKSPYITEERINIIENSETYQEYNRLRLVANDFELNRLLVHPSPVIRVYAHRALIENGMQPNNYHLQLIASDSTNIDWMQGDLMVKTTVMDIVSENMFMIERRDTLTFENTPS